MWKRSHQKSALADEKVPHFVPAVIEDQRAPILVSALAWVLVFVERRAVEPRQRPFVPREMRRHPVDDDADAGLVQRVDQELKIVRCPVTAGRRA